ncbi:MAG: DUF4127 family protein [Acidobacteria bacterium]|nr:DUF4127 family protein [Acidobacteriota bacterium]
MYGYASWNTAGNTIGTALPQGIVFSVIVTGVEFQSKNWRMPADEYQRRNSVMTRASSAQYWFILNRLFDDYLYHSIVRPKAIALAREKGWNVFRFNEGETRQIEQFGRAELQSRIPAILRQIALPPRGWAVCKENPKEFNFRLPWGRTFEAELDFVLDCVDSNNPKRRVKSL